jgi:hypothetical protein
MWNIDINLKPNSNFLKILSLPIWKSIHRHQPSDNKPEARGLILKPIFTIDIVKRKQALKVTCSFLQGTPQNSNYLFAIRYVTKSKNCFGFMKVDRILKIWFLLN